MKTKYFFTAVIVVLAMMTASAQEKKQELKIDVAKSTLAWTGKKVTGEHHGKINLKEGSVTVKDYKIVSGKFVIDMNSITDEDLTDSGWNSKLVGHLKSDDFFGVATYPEAVLELTGSTPLVNNKTKITGNLTIKGISHPIEFEATKLDNEYSATITVDRSLYNVRYGSGKFFQNLGDKTIYDEFTMDVKLVVK
jgi:polyisoprenoid-binding protein YceI